VTISLPQDIQSHSYDYPSSFFEKHVWRVERPKPSQSSIREAIGLLERASRPVILAGGGIHYSEAWHELAQFSERLRIPVVETVAGRGAIKNQSEYLLGGHGVTGNPSAGQIVSRADLVVSIGTRLTDFATGSQSAFNNPAVKFININVSSHDAFKQGALPVIGDAREALRELLRAIPKGDVNRKSSYLKEVRAARQHWDNEVRLNVYRPTKGERMSQGEVIGVLNSTVRSGDTVVAASGSAPADLHKLWDCTSGSLAHIEFGFSCMGYEIPAGIGVRMSQPKGEVYVLIGDGTYLMSPTEIVTAVQEGLKITLVLLENHGFQCIHNLQINRTGRSFGNEFRLRNSKTNRLEGTFVEIDFAKNAESMGARTWKVRTPGELQIALQEARSEERTCVIVAEIEKYHFTPPSGVWWDVAAAEVSRNSLTRKARVTYEEGRKLQRFHY
jgi:3D-(3,5/4)-trihydroxycyclohexane-1,2-dione acylhydrolase (decyclizing)